MQTTIRSLAANTFHKKRGDIIRECIAKKTTNITNVKHMLILDCDTHFDSVVLQDVVRKLLDKGIRPIVAAPAIIIEKEKKIFKSIIKEGIQFINHGYYQHSETTEFREYRNTFEYSSCSKEFIRHDIIKGHEILSEIWGKVPKVFRTPHFGLFQKPSELRFIHEVISKIGYSFSTSTGPKWISRKGYFWRANPSAIIECPATGGFTYPHVIIDSFTYRFSNSSIFTPSEYFKEVKRIESEARSQNGYRINMYADPFQVHDWEDFFDLQGLFAKWNTDEFNEYVYEN